MDSPLELGKPDPLSSFNSKNYMNDPLTFGDTLIIFKSDSTYHVFPSNKMGRYNITKNKIISKDLTIGELNLNGVVYQLSIIKGELALSRNYPQSISATFGLKK